MLFNAYFKTEQKVSKLSIQMDHRFLAPRRMLNWAKGPKNFRSIFR